MEVKSRVLLNLLVVSFALSGVQSASLLERSYEYVKGVASAYAPSLLAIASCVSEQDAWACARERAANMMDLWERDVEVQRRSWAEAADREVARAQAAGRAAAPVEPPSRVAGELEASLGSLVDLVQSSLARAMARKKGGGGIDTITLSTSSEKKKKMKKKKKRPQKIQIVQAHPQMMMMMKKHEKGRQLQDDRRIPIQAWVVGHAEDTHAKEDVKPPQKAERFARDVTDAWTPISVHVSEGQPKVARNFEEVAQTSVAKDAGRGLLEDAWAVGQHANDMMVGYSDDDVSSVENELREVEEQRGKKKKKKKAILKLLLLGAVAKAKIGTLLQILSAHLQIKFFAIALVGLLINIARFWLDLKKGHQPQKVIYYEHAQHQHHYEHEDEGWGGGGSYWSRSLDEPKEQENIYPAIETEHEEPAHAHSPYRAYGAPHRVAGRVAR